MALKQPKVPEYREGEELGRVVRGLILFLKDFGMDVWTANRQRADEIKALRREVARLRSALFGDGTQA